MSSEKFNKPSPFVLPPVSYPFIHHADIDRKVMSAQGIDIYLYDAVTGRSYQTIIVTS